MHGSLDSVGGGLSLLSCDAAKDRGKDRGKVYDMEERAQTGTSSEIEMPRNLGGSRVVEDMGEVDTR